MNKHLKRLKEKNIVIHDIYKDKEGTKTISSDGTIFDIVDDGIKVKKEFYHNGKKDIY